MIRKHRKTSFAKMIYFHHISSYIFKSSQIIYHRKTTSFSFHRISSHATSLREAAERSAWSASWRGGGMAHGMAAEGSAYGKVAA
jgi:hypothetical protein